MGEKMRENLHYFISLSRPYMVEQLQKEVPEYLMEQSVLTQSEFEEITSYESREDQIALVLDVIPKKTAEQVTKFYQYLTSWYPWILAHYESLKQNDETDNEFRTALDEGEVPALPFRHVQRRDEYMKLLNILHNVKRNEYVVVHGMRGCGKSTLVSSTLHSSASLVLDTFCKKVFWLSIGQKNDEFTVQLDLCGRFASVYAVKQLPSDSRSAKDFLKDRFKRDELTDCLLILDDVPSAAYVNALDVGCKILITTDDINIMNGVKKRVIPVKVSDGFTERETLKLFSESIAVKTLPLHAKNVHAICKGFPLTISLIASQIAEYEEDVKQNTNRWEYIESKLKQDGITANIGPYDRRSDQIKLLYTAIDESIKSLDDDLRKMYLNFALFMEEVNIRPEVLGILWEKEIYDVHDIMIQFERKNLIIKAWNSAKNTYVYCVHDLLLQYLKRLLTENEKKTLHREFINCYRQKYGNDFNSFPVDDNYILLYLGYHLKEADMIEEFPDFYLNLSLVEKKIMYYGAADLLFDFKKYKSQIAQGEVNSKKYEDFTHFISRVAACKSISNCNLVQFGLWESKQSAVYEAAIKLKRNLDPSNYVNKYFELLTDAPVENSPPQVFHDRDEIITAAFTCNKDVLIANSKNLIRRMNVTKHNFFATKTFAGHRKRINKLQMKNHKNHSFFLSASDDATVRVWNANGSGSGDFENRRTPSPQLQQPGWHDVWERQRSTGEEAVGVIEHDVAIRFAQFSNNPANLNMVMADTLHRVCVCFSTIENKGNEISVRYQNKVVIDVKDDVNSCAFSNDDSLVLCGDRSGISIYKSVSGDFVNRLNLENSYVKSMIIIPEISQITAAIVDGCSFHVIDIHPMENEQTYEFVEKARSLSSYSKKKTKDNYVCAAVSWDGKNLAIATTYYLHIYDISSGKEVLKFSESNGKIKNLCWSLENSMLLTSYNESKTIKLWTVQKDGEFDNCVKLRQSAFDAAWISDDDEDEGRCITAVLDNRKYINVFFDSRLEKELNPAPADDIIQVCVCPLNGDIVYALQRGEVLVIDTDNWENRSIINGPHLSNLKMKVFGSKIQIPDGTIENRTLVVVSAGSDTEKLCLLGWKKTVTENSSTIEEQIVFKPLPERLIRDFAADLKNNMLYVITVDHVFRIYDLSSGNLTRVEHLETYNLDTCLDDMKYSDISITNIVTANEQQIFVRTFSGDMRFMKSTSEVAMKTCKFSPNAKYLVVGFENSGIEIYNVDRLSKEPMYKQPPFKFHPGPAIDVFWAPSSDRFIVIFEREMSSYTIEDANVNLIANLYMSVEKIVSDPLFSKSATVDSNGHFHVFKHPF